MMEPVPPCSSTYAVPTDGTITDRVDEGHLADNILFFGRALRRAGLKIGPGAVADAIQAVDLIGIGSRDEFYAALFCIFVKKHEDQPVFDEAFELFWRSRDMIGKMMALMSPRAPPAGPKEKQGAGHARVSDALVTDRDLQAPPADKPEIEMDASFTTSDRALLRRRDFAQMTARELAKARLEMSRMVMPMDDMPTRRFAPSRRPGRIDPRQTMRQSLRSGGDLILPRFRKRKVIPPPLVVLADISGSMSQYTRIFLHFLHVLTEKRRRVHTFLFGTELTNVTRQMKNRDPDEALEQCSGRVKDWSGGTRIGQTLHDFNRLWSRRVLGQGAVVLLITDGLERDDTAQLSREMDRLHRSCKHLVWLNPLLRFDGFEARARGVRAMLTHVDAFRPVHNLDSIGDLAGALSSGRLQDGDPKRFLQRRSTAA